MIKEKIIIWSVAGVLALLILVGITAYVVTRSHRALPTPSPSKPPSPSSFPPTPSGCRDGEFGDKCQSNQCNACPMYFSFEGVDDTNLSCAPTVAYKRKCLGAPCEPKAGETAKFPLAEYVNGDPAAVATKRKQWAQENLTVWDKTVKPCSGNGTCSADGKCKCAVAYYGNSCADKYCGSQDPKYLSKWHNEAACCTTAQPDTVNPGDTVCQYFGPKYPTDNNYGIQRCTVPQNKDNNPIAAFDEGVGFSYCYSNICPPVPVRLLRQYHSDKQCCTDDLYSETGEAPPDGTTVCANYPGTGGGGGVECLRSCTYVAGAPLAPGQSNSCTKHTDNTCVPNKISANGKDYLLPNMYLGRNEFLESGNGFRFGLSKDGKTAQKFYNAELLWDTTMPGWGVVGINLKSPASSITMEQGTWVMKAGMNGSGQTLAHAAATGIGDKCTANPLCVQESGACDCCPRRLVIQRDGNLVIYRGPNETDCPNCSTWSTVGGGDHGLYSGGGPMAVGKVLNPISPTC
jgi:hypothetical protein